MTDLLKQGTGRRAYVHRHIVTLDETNLVGNVYFAHYLHWQGHCRERFLADHAPGVLGALGSGDLALVTLNCRMEFHAECFALDEIEVRMTLRDRGGHRIGMDFDFVRAGRIVATGAQTVACMQRTDTGVRPAPIPQELAGALIRYAG